MASLRLRSNGNYSLDFRWKGKSEIRALGISDKKKAEDIKAQAEEQLQRIKYGESPVASRLLAKGYSIVDVLFGSEEITAELGPTDKDNPLTVAELFDQYLAVIKSRSGYSQMVNTESWSKKVRGIFRDERRIATLTLDDIVVYKKRRSGKDGVGDTSINRELGTLRSAIKWAVKAKLLEADPIVDWPSLKTKRQKRFEWKSDIDEMIESHEFANESERKAFMDDLSIRMVLTKDDLKNLVNLARKHAPHLVLPLKIVCSTGIRRKELVVLQKQDFDPHQGTIIVGSKKQSKKIDTTYRTIVLPDAIAKEIETHQASLPRNERMLFPIFGDIDAGYSNRWIECQLDQDGHPMMDAGGKKIPKLDRRGKPIPSKRKMPNDVRRVEKAGRLLSKLIKGTEFELMKGWRCLRHSFISICVAKGLTWEQV